MDADSAVGQCGGDERAVAAGVAKTSELVETAHAAARQQLCVRRRVADSGD